MTVVNGGSANALEGILELLGGVVLGSHSDWRRGLMAFRGRAWYANHPVLRQAHTMRNFPIGYSGR